MNVFMVRAGIGLSLLAAMSPAQPASQAKEPFENEIRAYETADAKQMPKLGGVVFVGSSSIRGWRTLAKDFPRNEVLNRGFGGSQVAHSVRYAHRIVTPYKPTMVVLFAGTNDLASGKSAETVAKDFSAFVGTVRSKLPKTRIAYISISPAPSRWKDAEKIRTANRLIQAICIEGENLVFIDVFHAMLDANAQPRPELFGSDQLHMNPKGYAIWKKVVAAYLPWDSKSE